MSIFFCSRLICIDQRRSGPSENGSYHGGVTKTSRHWLTLAVSHRVTRPSLTGGPVRCRRLRYQPMTEGFTNWPKADPQTPYFRDLCSFHMPFHSFFIKSVENNKAHIPALSHKGQRLFCENLQIGVAALESDAVEGRSHFPAVLYCSHFPADCCFNFARESWNSGQFTSTPLTSSLLRSCMC